MPDWVSVGCLKPILPRRSRTVFDDGDVRCMSVRIHLAKRITPHITVKIKALRVAEISIGHRSRLCCPIRNHEAAEAAVEVSRSKIVESGFGIPFFAGEVKWADIRPCAGLAVSEGQVVAGLIQVAQVVGPQVLRSQPVGEREIRDVRVIRSKVPPASVYLTPLPGACRLKSRDDVAGQIGEVVGFGSAEVLLHSLARPLYT